MADLKTKPTDQSVDDFLQAVPDGRKRRDSYAILEMMARVTGVPPKMWGSSIVGFGTRHYRYASGREGDWFITGFSPRKQNLTLYLAYALDRYEALLKKLGKHKIGKGCLYVNKLDDIDMSVLEELITQTVEEQAGTGAKDR
jgi:hypothetical protein